MSARYRLLLTVPAALLALSACTSAADPAPHAAEPTKTTAANPTATTPAATTETAGCPSAETLEGLVELPKDWRFASVECVGDWAAADPEGPNPGDGFYLFKKSGTTWKLHGEGSGYDCKELGLDKAPFCIS